MRLGTYSSSGTFRTGTSTITQVGNGASSEETSEYRLQESFVYRGGETQVTVSGYSRTGVTDGTSVGAITTSTYTIFTTYNTAEYTSFYTTTSTGTDPFIPTFTTTQSSTYTARVRFTFTNTFLDTDFNSPFIASTSSSITFTYLSQATDAPTSASSNTFLTISTFTSSASQATSSSVSIFRNSIGFSTSTDIYQDRTSEVTVYRSISNWWDGGVGGQNGGAMAVKAGNVNVVQKFTDFSITTQNTTIYPRLSALYSYRTKSTANFTATYSRITSAVTEKPFTYLGYQTFQNTAYQFDHSEGKVTSTTIEGIFGQTITITDQVTITTTQQSTAPVGSEYRTFINAIFSYTTLTATAVLGSEATTGTYQYLQLTRDTGLDYSLYPACTSTQNSGSDSGQTADSSATVNFSSSSSYRADEYHEFQEQDFDTETAKFFTHIAVNPLPAQGQPIVVKKKHGQYQFAEYLYLHTNNSNKTNNTGYFDYSNNLSNNVFPMLLTYNSPQIVPTNNQLTKYQSSADNLYTYNAGFGQAFDTNGGIAIGSIVTPMSNSSYSWTTTDSNTNTVKIIAQFGGASDYASYTKIQTSSVGTITTSTILTGTISYSFANSAGTGHYIDGVYPYRNIFGGKQRVYTASDEIKASIYRFGVLYRMGSSFLSSYRTVNYLVTDVTGNASSDSSSDTTYFSADSTINNSSLKYMNYDNDSWILIDRPITATAEATAWGVISPIYVFALTAISAAEGGRGINASFQSYYGSTYST